MKKSRFSTRIPAIGLLVWVWLVSAGCSLGKKAVGTVDVNPDKGKVIEQIHSVSSRCTRLDEPRRTHWNVLRNDNSYGVIAEPEIQQYVNRIMDKLVRAWGGAAPELSVFLTGGRGYGAYTYSDCSIYLSVHVLEKARDEGEVAAILAHELSHVVLNHTASDDVRDSVGWAGRAASIAAAVSAKSGSDPSSRQVGLGGRAADSFSTHFLGPVWSSAQEEEADILGVDILVKAGYDPNEMRYMLRNVGNEPTNALADVWFRLTGESVAEGAKDRATQSGMVLGVKFLTAKLASWFRKLDKNHPDKDVRIQKVNDYLDREYRS